VKGNVESKMPIGATPTVVSANSKTVTVSLMATLSNGYTKAQVVEEINGILKAYFKEIALSEASYISYAYIGSKILESKGVSDYTSLTVNDGTANITLNSDEVAVLSEVVILD